MQTKATVTFNSVVNISPFSSCLLLLPTYHKVFCFISLRHYYNQLIFYHDSAFQLTITYGNYQPFWAALASPFCWDGPTFVRLPSTPWRSFCIEVSQVMVAIHCQSIHDSYPRKLTWCVRF
jgi:hypothetical protein